MTRRGARWLIAAAGSLLVHAAALPFLASSQETIDVAGGGTMTIAVNGSAFEDLILAGDLSDDDQPMPMHAASTVVKPDPPDDETIAPASAPDITTQSPVATERAPTERQHIVAPEGLLPDQTPLKHKMHDAAGSVTAAVSPRLSAKETVERLEPDKKPAAMQPKTPAKKPENRAENRKNSPAAGNKGNAEQAAKIGNTKDAHADTAKPPSRSAGKAGAAEGNAARSNYPGLVVSKLRRALRYPASARRAGLRGEVLIHFVVSRNGNVGSVRVASSSGSPVLDRAAIDTVRRAAPFPAIPSSANRSSWQFTLPIAFQR